MKVKKERKKALLAIYESVLFLNTFIINVLNFKTDVNKFCSDAKLSIDRLYLEALDIDFDKANDKINDYMVRVDNTLVAFNIDKVICSHSVISKVFSGLVSLSDKYVEFTVNLKAINEYVLGNDINDLIDSYNGLRKDLKCLRKYSRLDITLNDLNLNNSIFPFAINAECLERLYFIIAGVSKYLMNNKVEDKSGKIISKEDYSLYKEILNYIHEIYSSLNTITRGYNFIKSEFKC